MAAVSKTPTVPVIGMTRRAEAARRVIHQEESGVQFLR
jgi:hypothetical protein